MVHVLALFFVENKICENDVQSIQRYKRYESQKLEFLPRSQNVKKNKNYQKWDQVVQKIHHL